MESVSKYFPQQIRLSGCHHLTPQHTPLQELEWMAVLFLPSVRVSVIPLPALQNRHGRYTLWRSVCNTFYSYRCYFLFWQPSGGLNAVNEAPWLQLLWHLQITVTGTQQGCATESVNYYPNKPSSGNFCSSADYYMSESINSDTCFRCFYIYMVS